MIGSKAMATLLSPITADDYKILPESGPRYQLIEGALELAPAPNSAHQQISGNLFLIIGNWTKSAGHGGKVIAAPLDVYLDKFNVYQPDIVYLSPDNLGILTTIGIEGAPDLVIEILSPSTRVLDLGPKKKNFARYKVKEFWAVDPAAETIEVFDLCTEPDSPVRSLARADQLESAIFPGLVIDLEEVFDL